MLLLRVCILLRVRDQGEGVFPSTQRYYTTFYWRINLAITLLFTDVLT
jgi:hypothetical protein